MPRQQVEGEADTPTTSTNTHDKDGAESLASQLGLNRIGEQLQGLVSAMADRGVTVVTDRLDGLTNKMSGATGKTVKNMAKVDHQPLSRIVSMTSARLLGAGRSKYRLGVLRDGHTRLPLVGVYGGNAG